MNDLLVIVPSRGRPTNIAELQHAWRDTEATADLLVGLDLDDPLGDLYPACANPSTVYDRGPRLGMCGTLNTLAVEHADRYRHIGFMGDDHRPRTRRWDEWVRGALSGLGTGIVYGDDLIHGENLPTAVFMSSDIIRALGYMAPPELQHLYLDNFWLTLGRELGAIRYLPDMIIEHMHPLVGKAPNDDGYERANAWSVQEHDRVVFEHWREHQMAADVEKIRRASQAVP